MMWQPARRTATGFGGGLRKAAGTPSYGTGRNGRSGDDGTAIGEGRGAAMSGIPQAVIDFVGQHPHWAGLLIFLIALTESVAVIGLLIPGSPILIGVGAVVGLGHLPLW